LRYAIELTLLPADIDSMKLRDTLLHERRIIVKMSEKHQFNGFRLSPHILDTEAQVDTALAALRAELA
jgi:hypothetical protein